MIERTRRVFDRLTPGGSRNFLDDLRAENTGAVLLLVATALALVLANSPWADAWSHVAETTLGPAALHLDLSVADWAKDGLLAVFFFVVGLELKREIVDGQLRRPATAIVPIVAAVGGMVAPALLYTLVNSVSAGGDTAGWATPVATDIAFAVAVLSAFGRGLPTALRAFLLTLAVVDDLLGIVVIAVFYSSDLELGWLGACAAAVVLFAVAVRRRPTWWLLTPLALAAWATMHASGIHATIAGVVLGFTVPALARPGEAESLAARLEHRWRPVSAGVAVPAFAFFAAGVPLSATALTAAVGDPVARGVWVGLVLGKPLGIVAATALVVRLSRARLGDGVQWPDLVAVATVGGIGFTVSLLIGGLSFPPSSPHAETLRAAVLLGSTTSAVIGAVLLRWRCATHRRLADLADEDLADEDLAAESPEAAGERP